MDHVRELRCQLNRSATGRQIDPDDTDADHTSLASSLNHFSHILVEVLGVQMSVGVKQRIHSGLGWIENGNRYVGHCVAHSVSFRETG
ncbi:hypothetical protein RBSWK_04717 [Rhodopirellula baltica SWK14]|uniref:Uncharacterized protein n=1 Tax=Rhodopirellula baltica SWK14 TaxID=993516 RepID=L7CC84_RHOBT|nr:hypothetical protein RBSWK_04717 [Rhodopirellula baltica SWK14]